MYYIEKIPIAEGSFLAGSVPEPSAAEVAWSAKAWAVGDECIRPGLHRVFKCAVARTASDAKPPEQDSDSWKDIRATDRYTPFGPMKRADGKVVYESRALQLTADIEFRLKLRYCNAVAIFGLQGAAWSVNVYDKPQASGGVLVAQRGGNIKAPSRSYWDYAYGERQRIDRVIVNDLPIYPSAEVVIKITGSGDQMRAVSQIECGKLRYLPGARVSGWEGGVEYGLQRSPRAYSYRKDEADGSSTTLLYGSTYDMSGSIKLPAQNENAILAQLRNLLGQGAAFAPSLRADFGQSLVFGTLQSAPVSRDTYGVSSVNFQIKGLPT